MPLLAITESDAYAISMLGVILVGLGVVGMLLLCMAKNARRRDLEIEKLLEEVAAMENPKTAKVSESPFALKKQPWEKDADWWR